MKTESILQADVLDIIFENRNKNYGAYTLRKFYNNRLYKALGGTFAIVCLLCSFTLIKPKVVKENIITATPVEFREPPIDKKKKDEPVEKEKAKPEVAKKRPMPSDAFTTINVTKKTDVVALTNLTPESYIGIDNIKTPDGEIPRVGDLPGLGKDTIAIAAIPKPAIDKVTPNLTVDVMPEYPGGMKELFKFLQKNLVNPQDLEEGEKVSVKIKFIVGYDGKLKGFETVEDGGTAFNNEVIRVLKKMPTWIPGKMSGESVSVYYTVPVKFVVEN